MDSTRKEKHTVVLNAKVLIGIIDQKLNLIKVRKNENRA